MGGGGSTTRVLILILMCLPRKWKHLLGSRGCLIRGGCMSTLQRGALVAQVLGTCCCLEWKAEEEQMPVESEPSCDGGETMCFCIPTNPIKSSELNCGSGC